jgi:hypothetical protein
VQVSVATRKRFVKRLTLIVDVGLVVIDASVVEWGGAGGDGGGVGSVAAEIAAPETRRASDNVSVTIANETYPVRIVLSYFWYTFARYRRADADYSGTHTQYATSPFKLSLVQVHLMFVCLLSLKRVYVTTCPAGSHMPPFSGFCAATGVAQHKIRNAIIANEIYPLRIVLSYFWYTFARYRR